MWTVHASHRRPPVAWQGGALSPRQRWTGIAVAVAMHGPLPGLIVLIFGLITGWGFWSDRDTGPPPRVVRARFVNLGKTLPDNQLPNRRVPIKTTAPAEGIAVSKNPKEPPPKQTKKERPKEATEDFLERLGERAQDFAEIAEREEEEGAEDGVRGGAATAIGERYYGELYRFFRRDWSVPDTLAASELRRLVIDVDVYIDERRRVRKYRVRKESGNELFDLTVENRLKALQSQRLKVPEPPPEIEDDILGRWVGAQFYGRDAP